MRRKPQWPCRLGSSVVIRHMWQPEMVPRLPLDSRPFFQSHARATPAGTLIATLHRSVRRSADRWRRRDRSTVVQRRSTAKSCFGQWTTVSLLNACHTTLLRAYFCYPITERDMMHSHSASKENFGDPSTQISYWKAAFTDYTWAKESQMTLAKKW